MARLPKKFLRVVHAAVLVARRVGHVQRSDLEHLARAFAVGGGDDGRVDVDKAALLEELMNRGGGHASHTENCGEEVSARPEVLYGAQELHAVALLLQRVVGRGYALNLDGVRLELKGLLGLGSEHQLAVDNERRADVLAGYLVVVFEVRAFEHYLKVGVRRAVIEFYEAEILHVADGTCPAADRNLAAGKARRVGKNSGDPLTFHAKIPPGAPPTSERFVKISLSVHYVCIYRDHILVL